jgi:hypothetical protein
MAAPLLGAAAIAAARLLAKKMAKDSAKKAVKKAIKTASKSKPLAEPKSAVRVLPRKTAPKSDLSNRGARLTKTQRVERAQDYQFDKSLGKYYSNQDRIAGTSPSELAKGSRGEGVKSARKTAAIKKEAKPIVKINSAPKKAKTKSDARGLKAANKPVSKGNRNRFGDGEMSSYLKSAKPARANRTRAGKSVPK